MKTARLIGCLALPAVVVGTTLVHGAPRFVYDQVSGECRSSDGSRGLNSLDAPALLGHPTLVSNHPTFTGVDAECTDFAGFDLAAYLHRQHLQPYYQLQDWNLRGANLDGANFMWTMGSGLDFSGAHMAGLRLGYSDLRGFFDAHTVLNAACKETGIVNGRRSVDCRF